MKVFSKVALTIYLQESGVLKTPLIIDAFNAIDRKDFLPENIQDMAYSDEALPIGEGQTISQPYTVAFMLGLLDPRPGHIVLDVGAGSGWQTALLAHIVSSDNAVRRYFSAHPAQTACAGRELQTLSRSLRGDRLHFPTSG